MNELYIDDNTCINRCSDCNDEIISYESRNSILNIISLLPMRYRAVLMLRIIEKRDLTGIARCMGITRERIRQIEEKVFKTIIKAHKAQTGIPIKLKIFDIIKAIEDNKDKIPGVIKKEFYVLDNEYWKMSSYKPIL